MGVTLSYHHHLNMMSRRYVEGGGGGRQPVITGADRRAMRHRARWLGAGVRGGRGSMLAGAVVSNGKRSYSGRGSVPSKVPFSPHPPFACIFSVLPFLFYHFPPHLPPLFPLLSTPRALSLLLRPIPCPLSFLSSSPLSLSRRFYHFSSDKQRPGYCSSWRRAFFTAAPSLPDAIAINIIIDHISAAQRLLLCIGTSV